MLDGHRKSEWNTPSDSRQVQIFLPSNYQRQSKASIQSKHTYSKQLKGDISLLVYLDEVSPLGIPHLSPGYLSHLSAKATGGRDTSKCHIASGNAPSYSSRILPYIPSHQVMMNWYCGPRPGMLFYIPTL